MSNLEYEEFISLHSAVGYKIVHKCKYCWYFSDSIFFMRNHLRRHRSRKEKFSCQKNQLEMFYCRECNFKTEILVFLIKHFKEVHASHKGTIPYILRNYTCKKCLFQTFSLLHWLGHVMNNNCGNCLIDCDNNGYFKYLQILNQFSCDQCSYRTNIKRSLKIHKIHKHTSQENINWFNCDECPYKSKNKSHIKIHKICKHTSENEINWLKCDQCPYKSKQKAGLKVHKMYKHTLEEDINWFKCNQCSYKSKEKHSLINHTVCKHTSEENIHWFKCDQCPYESKWKGSLRAHKVRMHTSEENIQWYKCDQCSYKSKVKHGLKAHKDRMHT